MEESFSYKRTCLEELAKTELVALHSLPFDVITVSISCLFKLPPSGVGWSAVYDVAIPGYAG